MGFHIGPKVISATGGSIHRVGNNRIHHFPPQHATDGLIMFFEQIGMPSNVIGILFSLLLNVS